MTNSPQNRGSCIPSSPVSSTNTLAVKNCQKWYSPSYTECIDCSSGSGTTAVNVPFYKSNSWKECI